MNYKNKIIMQETTSGVKIPIIYERFNPPQTPNIKEPFLDRTFEYFGKICIKVVELFIFVVGR